MDAPKSDAGRARTIFREALGMAWADRAAYLERACEGKPGMREEVESLLRAADQASTVLEATCVGARSVGKADTPTVVGPYRVLRSIGEGGMGVVYLCEHAESGSLVAVKAVRLPRAGLLSSIRREIHALSRLHHPGIVRIQADGIHAGMPWYAMELIEGTPLRWEAQADHRRALTFVRRLCSPLGYIHGEGLVHRDLKPGNILATAGDVPVIVDFGLTARFASDVSREELELDTGIVGTVRYMAPEQGRGEMVDARADLYSLGCILYELLTGRPPFEGDHPLALLHQHQKREPDPPSAHADGISSELDDLVLRLLAKDPSQRIGFASDVALAMEKLGGENGCYASAPTPRCYLYRPGFVGRHQEVRRLCALLEQAKEGRGGLVFLKGESGVGKTRLMVETARLAEEMGLQVLLGQCDESKEPLQGLRGAMRAIGDWCREKGAVESDQIFGARGKLLARYEPTLVDLPGQDVYREPEELPAPAGRARLFRCLTETLQAFAAERAVLLVVDDAQWADELTLGFLASMEPLLGASRLLVAATVRAEELPPDLQEIGSPGALWMELGRLDEEGVSALLCGMLGMPGKPSGFVRFLSRQTEGNPFFVAEYVRAALHEGVLSRDGRGVWQLGAGFEASSRHFQSLEMPSSIKRVVEQHLAMLGHGAWRLASVLAAIGREADGKLVALASRMDERSMTEALGELSALHLVEEWKEGRYGFVHDKIREVAYGRLRPERRKEIHRWVAESMEAMGAGEGELLAASLGRHWEHAGEPARARACYLTGARRALAVHAHREAERLYRAYLALVDRPTPESVRVRNQLGWRILFLGGRKDEAEAEHRRAYVEAREIGDESGVANSLGRLAIVYLESGRSADAKDCCEESLRIARAAGDRRHEGQALSTLGSLCHHEGRMEMARAFFEEAVTAFLEVGNPKEAAIPLSNLASIEMDLGRMEEARVGYERAIAIHRQVGNRYAEGVVLGNLGNLHRSLGSLDEARRVYALALSIHQQVGNRRGEGDVLANLGSLNSTHGAPAEARQLLEGALTIHREVGDRRQEGRTLHNLGRVYQDEGEMVEAREKYEQALAIHRETRDRVGEGVVLGFLAFWELLADGDLDEAGELSRQGEAALVETGNKYELGDLLCERGHIVLAGRKSAAPLLEGIRALSHDLGIKPVSELGEGITRLERAQRAFEQGEALIAGHCPEDIKPGVLRWLRTRRPGAIPPELGAMLDP